jgi:glutamine synthetase
VNDSASIGALQERGVRAIRLLYTDLHGIARGKDIPVGKAEHLVGEGVAFCAAVMGTDLRHTPVVGGEEGYVDFVVKADLGTLRVVPWQPDVAWCVGDAMLPDGSGPAVTCARGAVARAVARYGALGLTPIVGPELEFFLLERDPTAPGGVRRYVDELSRVYTVGAVSDPRGIVLDMLYACDELGLRAFAANHEFMSSQYEINIEHSDAVDAADRAFLLKTAVKEIAARQGMLATFMGKPFNDQGGSGFHVHLSDGGDPHGLGTVRSRFVAGVLEHGPALMAILAPTVNAYKRLVPDSLAPTHVNWGHDNRTAFVRVPNESGSRSRVEVRAGDGSAAPHLVIAALLLARRLPRRRLARGLEAPREPRRLARRPRGRRVALRGARRGPRGDVLRDEAIRARSLLAVGHRLGARRVCAPSLSVSCGSRRAASPAGAASTAARSCSTTAAGSPSGTRPTSRRSSRRRSSPSTSPTGAASRSTGRGSRGRRPTS